MRKLLSGLVGILLLTFVTAGGEAVLMWDVNTNNAPGSVIATRMYVSTNIFSSINWTQDIPDPENVVTQQVNTGVLYSAYLTAVGTNALESEPSNQIRYQRFNVKIERDNPITLGGSTNWIAAVLVNPPTNGILSGTPPNLTYRPTNYLNQVKDSFVYKIPETFSSQNITNWYSVHFSYLNTPPDIPAEPDYISQ